MREREAQRTGMRSAGLALAGRARRVRELVVADLERGATEASIAVTPPVPIASTLEDELALLRGGQPVVRPGRRFTVQTAAANDIKFEVIDRRPRTARPEPEQKRSIRRGPDPAPAPRVEPVAHPKLEPPPESQPKDSWNWSEPWAFELDGMQSRAVRHRQNARRRAVAHQIRRRRAVAAIVLAALMGIALLAISSIGPAAVRKDVSIPPWAHQPRPSDYAKRVIPPSYMKLYWRVGEEYGLDWTKLAAVVQIESDHGRSQLAGVHRGTNRAGAAGPAQFVSSTWARYGVDGDGNGQIDPHDPADAVSAMAAYLKASGAPQRWRLALFTYNHSSAYVHAVMDLSHRFLGRPITPRSLPGPI